MRKTQAFFLIGVLALAGCANNPCVFRANRPPSPAETGHPVHGNPATRSAATPGVIDVYSDSVSCVNFGLCLRSDSPFKWIW